MSCVCAAKYSFVRELPLSEVPGMHEVILLKGRYRSFCFAVSRTYFITQKYFHRCCVPACVNDRSVAWMIDGVTVRLALFKHSNITWISVLRVNMALIASVFGNLVLSCCPYVGPHPHLLPYS